MDAFDTGKIENALLAFASDIPESTPLIRERFVKFGRSLSSICIEIRDFAAEAGILPKESNGGVESAARSGNLSGFNQVVKLEYCVGVLDSMTHEMLECIDLYYETVLCVLSWSPHADALKDVLPASGGVPGGPEAVEEENEVISCLGIATEKVCEVRRLIEGIRGDFDSKSIRWCQLGNLLHSLLEVLFVLYCLSGFRVRGN